MAPVGAEGRAAEAGGWAAVVVEARKKKGEAGRGCGRGGDGGGVVVWW